MMQYNAKFWLLFAGFQVVFGFAVFAITRDYYLQDADEPAAHSLAITQPGSTWPASLTSTQIEQLTSPLLSDASSQDPTEISRQADEYFANGQYARAVQLYEKLLGFWPDNADVYNNLGLTLHYVGRSDEALQRLNEGVAVDPQYQRIWLTLGFVNGQLGNAERAREALTTAIRVGSDEQIRQSAQKMLDDLS